MSTAGLCETCGSPAVEFTCDRCGALVCEDHWDRTTGYCVECAAEVGGGGDGDDRPDGVDTYRS